MVLQHGISITTGTVTQAPPIDSPTVIGAVGTGTAGAPTAAINTPVAVHSLAEATAAFGSAGTLYDLCQSVFALTTVFIVGVRFDDMLANPTFGTAFPGSPSDGDLFRFTEATTGLTGATDEDGNALTDAAANDLFMFDTMGTPATSDDRWVRQATDNSRQGAVIRALDALATAETATGRAPTLIAAPDETYNALDSGAANLVAAKLLSTATAMDAMAWGDAANSTDAIAQAWDENNGGPRIIGIPQRHTTPDGTIPGSSFYVGAQAALDASEGSARATLSNKVLTHLSSVSPAYTFSYRRPSQASALTDGKGLMVTVRHDGVWRAWGGETRYGSATDPRRFYATQRILDQIEAHIVDIGVNMVGRGIRNNFVARLVSDIQDYLDGRVGAGDVSEATVTPDAAQNTAANLAAGRVYLQLSIRPTPFARLITLTIQITS